MSSTGMSVFGFVAGVVMAGALAFAGCSKAADQASRDLRQKVDVAQRLADNALGIAGLPAITSPSGKAAQAGDDPNTLEVLPACAILPEAIVKLNEAQQQLKSALAESPDADAADRAFAAASLGKVQAMTGYCYAAGVASDLSPVWGNLRKASDLLADMRAKAAAMAFYSSLMNVSDADAKKIQASAQEELQKKSAELATLEAEVKAQEDIIEKLKPKQSQLDMEATTLLVRSKGSSGKTALEEANQAIDKRSLANEIGFQIADAQMTRDAKDTRRKAVASEVDLAKALEGIGKEAIASAEARANEYKKQHEPLEGAIAESVRKLEAIAGNVSAAMVKAAADEKLAAEAYEASAQSLDKSYAGIAAADQAEFAVQRAQAAVAQAKMLDLRLNAAVAVAALSEQIKALWPKLLRPGEMPAVFATLTSQAAGDPAKVKEEQAKLYQIAIENYRKAMAKVRPELRWAYQGEIGSAYLSLFQATKSRDALTEAQKVLAEAVQNKEYSPYLIQVLEIQKQVGKLLNSTEQ